MRTISWRDWLSSIDGACGTFNHNLSSIYNNKIQKHLADAILSKDLSFFTVARKSTIRLGKVERRILKNKNVVLIKIIINCSLMNLMKTRLYTLCIGIGIFRIHVGLSKLCEDSGIELLNLLLSVRTPLAYCWKKFDRNK